jgi:N-acetylmuramoyl-L-alanine amidase
MSLDKLVCIDPGHGGKDPGAVSPQLGTKESFLNLRIARRLHDLINLTYQGGSILTRAEDTFVSLEDRVVKSNNWHSDFFVSLHCNSSLEPARGYEVWVYNDSNKAKRLADNTLEFLKEAQPSEPNRGAKESGRLFVLKNTRCPAILVEFGFMNDENFVKWALNENSQNQLAWAIARGLVKTMNTK